MSDVDTQAPGASRPSADAPPPSGDAPAPSWRSPAAKVVDAVDQMMTPTGGRDYAELGSGDVAELRRLDPRRGVASTCAPFWRLVVEKLEPAGLLQGKHQGLGPWIAILQGLAEAKGFHSRKVPLGRAMAEAEISEARLTRLLRAHGQARLDAIRPLAHHLRSQAKASDWGEVADLVLEEDPRKAEKLRQRVANDYYRAMHWLKLNKKNETTGAESA